MGATSPESSSEDDEHDAGETEGGILATAAATVVMLKKVLNMKKVPRRLISLAEHHREIFPSWRFVYICKFLRV
jgi:hypothetical protein